MLTRLDVGWGSKIHDKVTHDVCMVVMMTVIFFESSDLDWVTSNTRYQIPEIRSSRSTTNRCCKFRVDSLASSRGSLSRRPRRNGVCTATGVESATSTMILEPHLPCPHQQNGMKTQIRAQDTAQKCLFHMPQTLKQTLVVGTDSPESVEELNNNFKHALASQDRGHLCYQVAVKP